MKYYHKHLMVACVLSLVTLTPLAGAFFYVGREVRDLEKLHDWNMAGFDWRGFLWPVVPLVCLDVALRITAWPH